MRQGIMNRIGIIGSAGAIGNALVQRLAWQYPAAIIYAIASKPLAFTAKNIITQSIDYHNEESIEQLADQINEKGKLDLVIVTTGILHDDNMMPEKSLRDLSARKFQHLFNVNAILPAILAKHFIPHLSKQTQSIFAVLSARVGSISDNRSGGWYAYRASKAALNMIIKNVAIETARVNKKAIVIGLHPGTVDSQLSKPFQTRIPAKQLFTADYCAEKLLSVLNELTPKQSGGCYAWDGQQIQP